MADAVLFGSVGSIVHCSELQRAAFNTALKEKGYSFTWDKEPYVASLVNTGGKDRLQAYADSKGVTLSADEVEALHQRKTELTIEAIRRDKLEARPGVINLLKQAKAKGIKTALVTTTMRALVDAILESTNGLSADMFDLVLSKDDEHAYGEGKPSGKPYQYVVSKLKCKTPVALEDSQISMQSPLAAGIPCIGVPNENTGTQDYSKAVTTVAELGDDVALSWFDKLVNASVAPAL